MDVTAPEAGLPIDRDLILVTTLHRILVGNHKAKPIRLKFVVDSQRVSGVDGHYEAEYELSNGIVLKLFCKQLSDDMMFKVTRGRSQLNYSVKLAKYVNEDLMAINMRDCEDLVSHWLND
jgi:hypothetical protein